MISLDNILAKCYKILFSSQSQNPEKSFHFSLFKPTAAGSVQICTTSIIHVCAHVQHLMPLIAITCKMLSSHETHEAKSNYIEKFLISPLH